MGIDQNYDRDLSFHECLKRCIVLKISTHRSVLIEFRLPKF